MIMPVERAAVDPHSAWPQNAPSSGHVLSMVAAAVAMLGSAEHEGRSRQGIGTGAVRELASEQPNANICAKQQNVTVWNTLLPTRQLDSEPALMRFLL